MTDVLRITKLEAAQRQLNRAIRMHFAGDDPVCTHTLAGAASILLTDLVEHQQPGETWEEKARLENNLTKSEFFKVARKAQNFLKHARDDPANTLEFNPSDTDALLTLAVLNASELAPLSLEAQVFQLWSLALLCPADMVTESPFREAIAYFGGVQQMSRTEQMASGMRGLREFAPQ
jgi:hypothetical protein